MHSALACAEIDLSAIAHNIRELRRATRPEAGFMAVIKANAYGHGAVEIARLAVEERVDWLGVANVREGLALRKTGITLPILIFGYTPPSLAQIAREGDLTPSVFGLDMAERVSEHLHSRGNPLEIHLKVDTGMGRLGLPLTGDPLDLEKALTQTRAIASLPNLHLQGIYTHFADADAPDPAYTRTQLSRFTQFLSELLALGIQPDLAHAANSAALIRFPETHLDLVRPGIALYGSHPVPTLVPNPVDLKPAMTLKTRIIQIKHVPAGFKVSYNKTWETKAPTVIATVPVGYADGYNRLLSSRAFMLVKGQRAPVAGRVCMDLTMLDVGHIPGVTVEDEVVIFGQQEKEVLPVEELAEVTHTISYEIFTRIGDRVERIYHP